MNCYKIYRELRHTMRELTFEVIGRISAQAVIRLRYWWFLRRRINLKNPRDLNEKINWIKLYSDTDMWVNLTDKYRVREYVRQCGLEEILVPLYGHWEKAEDIDWETLPNAFVLKANNGSGDIIVCRDKAKLDKQNTTQYLARLLKTRFGYHAGESHYNKIHPCVVAEQLLDVRQQAAESETPIDYKIWCFDGQPFVVWACWNRHHDNVQVATYDLNWQLHPEWSRSTPHYQLNCRPMQRPKTLDRMLEVAARLSKGFPEVRVDLYEIGGRVYFGELTFTSAEGIMDFYTPEFLRMMGDKVTLPPRKA